MRRAAAILEGSKEPLILEKDGSFRLFEQEEAECFYTNGGGRVEARMKNGEVFFCRERIFELEEKLKGNFVKINQGRYRQSRLRRAVFRLIQRDHGGALFQRKQGICQSRTVGKIKAILGMQKQKARGKRRKNKIGEYGRY